MAMGHDARTPARLFGPAHPPTWMAVDSGREARCGHRLVHGSSPAASVVESAHVAMQNGTELKVRAGEVSSIPPGHDAWVVGDEAVVAIDWQGASDWAKL